MKKNFMFSVKAALAAVVALFSLNHVLTAMMAVAVMK